MWWITEENLARRIHKLPPGPKDFYWYEHSLVYGQRDVSGYVLCTAPEGVTQEKKDAIMNYAKAKYAHVVEN